MHRADSSLVDGPPHKSRRRSLIFPREHGAWGLLLIPFLTGAAVGLWSGGQILPLAPLAIATLALFWLRTPVESWLGTSPMRAQPGAELRLVRRTVTMLASVSLLALVWLFWGGRNRDLLWIGAGAAAAVLAQALLKKAWRRARIAAQMIGAAALTSTAPAAYYITAHWSSAAWTLWIANFLFAANQIQFVQLRIHAAHAATRTEKFSAGRGFLAGQLVLVIVMGLACGLRLFPWYGALAFLPVLYRGFAWFARKSEPLTVRALGWSELVYAILFGVLLVLGMGMARLPHPNNTPQVLQQNEEVHRIGR